MIVAVVAAAIGTAALMGVLFSLMVEGWADARRDRRLLDEVRRLQGSLDHPSRRRR
jgi:hypothetical protein